MSATVTIVGMAAITFLIKALIFILGDRVRFPHGPGVRVDGGFYRGYQIPIYYDSLLTKLVTLGRDRDQIGQRREVGQPRQSKVLLGEVQAGEGCVA